jgi:hypothetical protein
VYCHLTVMGLNDVLDDCQSQAGDGYLNLRVVKKSLVQVDCMTLDAPQGYRHVAEG